MAEEDARDVRRYRPEWPIPESVPPEGRANWMAESRYELEITSLPESVLVEEEFVEMRDGVELRAMVYRPDGEGAFPVITTMTPYGADRYEQWTAYTDTPGWYMGRLEISDHVSFEAPDPGFWVPHGYAVVVVDMPGQGKSEENESDPPPQHERWADVMAWLEERPWCTGSVGMNGVSALCITQWLAAQEAPPQLDAIVPWEGFNELGPGGGLGGIEERSRVEHIMEDWIWPNQHPDAVGTELLEGFLKADGDLQDIDVPALVCASFSDLTLHSFDTFEAFMRMSSEQKWLYSHRSQKWGRYYSPEALELQKRFYDRFLKGDEDAMDGIPTVHLEIHEDRFDHRVVHADDWPLPDTRHDELYLDATSDRLRWERPQDAGSAELAPEPVGDVDNRAVFDLRFDADTDIVGYTSLDLFVEAHDTDEVEVFVGVEKLDADGNEVYFFNNSGANPNGPVTQGWLRGKHRPRDPDRSWTGHPYPGNRREPLPEGVFELEIPIMPVGVTFRAGETMRLVVQCWSANGQFDGGEFVDADWTRLQTGPCTIHTGSEHPSRLNVPIAEELHVVDVGRRGR